MSNYLINFIDTNNILDDHQFGFRKSHSTNHAFISFNLCQWLLPDFKQYYLALNLITFMVGSGQRSVCVVKHC